MQELSLQPQQVRGADLQTPCLTCRRIQEEEDGALVGLLTSQGVTSLWGGREGETAGESNRSFRVEGEAQEMEGPTETSI
ncbi:unnamed protein product [Rangifer tarandus platyrhynchus]|uniref:Uncharacterized protein n=1 Tax=Rangifer tarandus platyrhynchus TaxID=3082113 RepID=A0AC59ZCS8_RANTA